jgi:hypothetical protein
LGFIFRSVRLITGLIFYAVIIIIAAIFYLLWLLIPLFIIFKIISSVYSIRV